jgi:hypothetical protein
MITRKSHNALTDALNRLRPVVELLETAAVDDKEAARFLAAITRVNRSMYRRWLSGVGVGRRRGWWE